MKRPLRPEETRLWAVVAATVRPQPGRVHLKPVASPAPHTSATAAAATSTPVKTAKPGPAPRTRPTPAQPPVLDPQGIEPRRRYRIARGREGIEARLDLHGLDQDRARARLLAFLLDAQAGGARAVLVITGKGHAGQGVLRRRTPEWLADPRLRGVVAGLSPAEAHHGGEGAYYIALKRKSR